MIADDGRLYNYAPVNYIQTPYERTNFFVEGNFAVTENIRFNTEVRANFRESAQELAPMPFDSRSGFDPAHKGVFNGTPYNGLPEDNFYLRQSVSASNASTGTPLLTQPAVTARGRRRGPLWPSG